MYGSALESTDVLLHGLNKAVKQIKPLRMKPPKIIYQTFGRISSRSDNASDGPNQRSIIIFL